MRINIIISDDQNDALKTNSSAVQQFIDKNNIDARITLCSTDPDEVLRYSEKNSKSMNVYILDINFNKEINGLTLARSIREQEPYAYIIFLTAYVQLSMLTFKYRLKVFDFLIKPVPSLDIEECLSALMEDFHRSFGNELPLQQQYITVKSGYQEYQIAVDDIIYIESSCQKLIIHTKEGFMETYATLKDMEIELGNLTSTFYRCHKSFVINLKYIKKIDLARLEVIMSTGETCLISRTQKSFFKKLAI